MSTYKDRLRPSSLTRGQFKFCVCEDCGEGFDSESAKLIHYNKTHTPGRARRLHSCAVCSADFRTVTQLVDHKVTAHPPKCGTCGRVFKRKRLLRHHHNNHSFNKKHPIMISKYIKVESEESEKENSLNSSNFIKRKSSISLISSPSLCSDSEDDMFDLKDVIDKKPSIAASDDDKIIHLNLSKTSPQLIPKSRKRRSTGTVSKSKKVKTEFNAETSVTKLICKSELSSDEKPETIASPPSPIVDLLKQPETETKVGLSRAEKNRRVEEIMTQMIFLKPPQNIYQCSYCTKQYVVNEQAIIRHCLTSHKDLGVMFNVITTAIKSYNSNLDLQMSM